MKSTDNTVTNNQSAKEMANMKKSNRTFESILAEAKKQQNQLDNARMAWSKAKTPAAKELAQKTGEKAKNRLEQLRRQWRNAKAASPVQEVKPAVKEAVVMSKEDELKKKYHELKVRGEQELFSACKEELSVFEASLKEKYAEKKKELHAGLLKLYREELAAKTSPVAGENASAPAAKPTEETKIVPVGKELVRTAPKIAMMLKGKKGLLIQGSIFKSASGNFYRVNASFDRQEYSVADAKGKQKMINEAIEKGYIEKTDESEENLLFPCDLVDGDWTVMEQNVYTAETDTSSKSEVVSAEAPAATEEEKSLVGSVIPQCVEDAARKAMEDSRKMTIEEGETFKDENGNEYVVELFFEIAVYNASDRAIQRKMIQDALKAGDIRTVKKIAA